MKVTIIIPNYNGKHFMEPCLQSLSEQTCRDFKVLVVDNASSDGSLEYMSEHYPDIEVISLKKITVSAKRSMSESNIPLHLM